MNTVGFPNMGLEFHPSRFISVFGFDIAWYAIIIAVGFMLACIYVLNRMKEFGLDSDRGIEAILAGMVGGIIGARLYFVVFSWDSFKDNVSEIFNMRNGGLAIYGGIIGALALGLLVCKFRNIKILPMLDVIALGFLIGQGIGRWGNFVNQEAYGSVVSDNYIFGMTGDLISEGMVHPCFLYESVWCLLGFAFLHFYSKKRKFDGEIALMYMVWYGAGRMLIEGLRTDSLYAGNFKVSQILSALILIVGVVILLTIYSRIKRNNDPDYLKLYVDTEESKEILKLAAERYKDAKKKDDDSEEDGETEEAETADGDTLEDSKEESEDAESSGEADGNLTEEAENTEPDKSEESGAISKDAQTKRKKDGGRKKAAQETKAASAEAEDTKALDTKDDAQKDSGDEADAIDEKPADSKTKED